jgi:hypothetical protein
MASENVEKNEQKYKCIICNFYTSKKTDYSRHLCTLKHKNNELSINDNKKNIKTYCCDICTKVFNDRSGLWRHKKKCVLPLKNEVCNGNINNDNDNQSIVIDKDMIMNFFKQNSELLKQNSELLKIIKNSTCKDTKLPVGERL